MLQRSIDGEPRALRDDRLAAELGGFAGVTLDRQAEAAIAAGGHAAADAAEDDPGEAFVRLDDKGDPCRGTLVPMATVDDADAAVDEPHWRHAGGDDPRVAIEAAVAAVKRAKRQPNWDRAPASAAPAAVTRP